MVIRSIIPKLSISLLVLLVDFKILKLSKLDSIKGNKGYKHLKIITEFSREGDRK